MWCVWVYVGHIVKHFYFLCRPHLCGPWATLSLGQTNRHSTCWTRMCSLRSFPSSPTQSPTCKRYSVVCSGCGCVPAVCATFILLLTTGGRMDSVQHHCGAAPSDSGQFLRPYSLSINICRKWVYMYVRKLTKHVNGLAPSGAKVCPCLGPWHI